MRYLLTIVIGLVLSGTSFGQQFPVFSQYMMNDFVINPAMAGTKPYHVTRLTFRKQWMGIPGSPLTQTLSWHMPIKDKPYGVGALLYNDITGPIRRTGLQGAYSYKIVVDEENTIYMGLGASAFQYSFNGTDLVLHQEGDNVLQRGVVSKILPDASFGTFYRGKDYYAGVSVLHLFQTKVKLSSANQSEIARLSRHYLVTGGYNIKVNNDVYIEPSFLFKAVTAAPMQVDVNAKAIFSDQFWVGASWRSLSSVTGMIGYTADHQFHIGYSFDITTSPLRTFSGMSHEIMIGYDIIETGTVLRKGKHKKLKNKKRKASKKKRKSAKKRKR